MAFWSILPSARSPSSVRRNVAKYIYATAAANGKRVQAQGGAKNPVIVLPDADMEMATKIIADSAFGCAGQRCLAVSFAVTVAEARNTFTELICDAASTRVVGYGLDAGVQMGPVINAASKARVEQLIGLGRPGGSRRPRGWTRDYRSRAMKAATLSVPPSWRMCRRGSEICQDRDLRTGAEPDARQHGG